MKAIRHAIIAMISLGIICVSWHAPQARKTTDDLGTRLIPQDPTGSPLSLDGVDGRSTPLRATAAPSTTVIAYWTFDGGGGSCVEEGWTHVDITAQPGDFWHVDDFAGLGGGSVHGLLYAPEGNQAMWCGARPDPLDTELCGYVALPGYGNNWDQSFGTVDCLDVLGDVTVYFLSTWDSEPGYDRTCIQFDTCGGDWAILPAISNVYYFDCIDGWDSGAFAVTIPDSMHSGNVRIRFNFTSDGAWSDEDGLWAGDGAIIIDSLSVTDAGGAVIPTETFETEAVGDNGTTSGNWVSTPDPGYGDFASLFNAITLVQEDPCASNFTCVWGFFSGSTDNYGCAGYPGQAAVPYGNERGQYIMNEVWSPWVPWVGSGTEVRGRFDVYRDLPLDPLVFYNYHIRWKVGTCPDGWVDTEFVFWGDQKDWFRTNFFLGHFTPSGATEVQFAVGVLDMCAFWCGSFGTGACHGHAPLFDNVEILRIDSQGPVFSTRGIDLFQDNFAGDGTTTGTVRADMAVDKMPSSNPAIRPGDSTVVSVNDPEVGLAGDPYTGFGPAVYMYVGVWPQGQPGKGGANLTEDNFRWPVVDSLTHNGDTWYCIRMDSVFTSPPRQNSQWDRFCVDLNDNLFTPGDTVCFVFAATSNAPVTRYYSTFTGGTEDLGYALSNPMEFTCLPTGASDILYVDDADGRGAQPLIDIAFSNLIGVNPPDRYDVRGPTSKAGNGPGARVINVSQQLVPIYRTIVWNSGDIDNGTIGDGSFGSYSDEKSDDFAMLYDFLHNHPNPGGVYISGDNVASDWDQLVGASATNFRNTYMNFTLYGDDHVADAGLTVSPRVIGEPGGCFHNGTTLKSDSLVAYGGCPSINDFDVLQATGTSTLHALYDGGPGGTGAVVGQFTTNNVGQSVGVILSGFSLHEAQNIGPVGDVARTIHLAHVLDCFNQPVTIGVAGDTPRYDTALAQNYPNPFNPTTAIEFTVKERAPVTLRVYNVRGQLIKTLVNEEREPGIVHHIEWNGRNDAGQSVASGVYFYRLVTTGYTQTKKMVMLK